MLLSNQKTCKFCGTITLDGKDYCCLFEKYRLKPLFLAYKYLLVSGLVYDIANHIMCVIRQLEPTQRCVIKRLGRLKDHNEFNKREVNSLLQKVNHRCWEITLEELHWSIKVTQSSSDKKMVCITHLYKFIC